MAEWLKAHAWKACIPQGIQGSNPCLSAKYLSRKIPRHALSGLESLVYGDKVVQDIQRELVVSSPKVW